MKHIYLAILLSLLCAGQGWAQNLSKDPKVFPSDIKNMMVATKNEPAVEKGSLFESAWNSGKFSEKQQSKIIEISQKMARQKMRARPHFENLISAILSAVNVHNMSGPEMEQFLDVTDKVIEKDELRTKERYLQSAAQFLDSKTIYTSKSVTLRAVGGTFAFEYNKGKQPKLKDPEPEPEPVKATEEDSWDNWDNWEKIDAKGNDGWGTEPVTKNETALKKVFVPEPQPDVTGATITLQNTDLLFVSPYDSVIIKQTSGDLMPAQFLFVGSGGKYTWTAAGNEATVDLKEYNFNITKPEFKAEDVTLHYSSVLENDIQGNFEFKSKARNARGESGFPRFISLTNDARLKSIGENIAYRGGFSLVGNRIMSAALDGSLSDIEVSLNGEKKFKASSLNYEIEDTLIFAKRAGITIYQENDSITHPALRLKYSKANHTLTLVKDDGAFREAPFIDSYHQMEIVADMLVWDLRTPLINLSILNAKNQIPARFESSEYYSDPRYQRLKGINSFHPLQMAVGYAMKTRKDKFYAADLAKYGGLKLNVLQNALAELAKNGYINYNAQTGMITLRQKAWHYVNAARDKKDYDHLVINSISPAGKNATLNLENNELIIRGIDKFYFTRDSASIYVEPDSGQVRVLKNRNMIFNGAVYTPNLKFRGQEFNFDYNGFYIDMGKVDSLVFRQKDRKKQQADLKEGEVLPAEQALNNLNGKLYLNRPDNKSGRKRYPGYPTFDALTGAVVYFNKPDILGGAYDSSVFFTVPPFKLDSLGSSSKASIGFNGEFHSGGIFPPFKTRLVEMPDKSLGFEYQVPQKGFSAYGKGQFFNKLTMTFKGLRGAGELRYLTTVLKADSFTFYLDSVTAYSGIAANVKEGKLGNAYYHEVAATNYGLCWDTKGDSMHIMAHETPMKMYKDKFTFRGRTTVTPDGLYGDGLLEGPDVFVDAPLLAFKQYIIKGNNAIMHIKSDVKDKPAVTARDVSMTYDMQNGYAEFKPERVGVISTEFPHSQYKTSLNGGRWDFKKKIVTLNAAEGENADKSYFFSTHPMQYGLKFKAKTGVYDLGNYTLIAGGVPYIASADAHIFPDSGTVYVTANANLKPFRNARIEMDTLRKLHQLYNGEIDIVSAREFRGNASYSFTNAVGETYNLRFSNFTFEPVETDDQAGKKKKRGTAETVDVISDINMNDVAAEPAIAAETKAKPKKEKKPKEKKAKPPKKNKNAAPEGDMPIDEGIAQEAAVTPADQPAAAPDSASAGATAALAEDGTTEALPNLMTKAVASIQDTAGFYLLPRIRFRGDIVMQSDKPEMIMNGEIKLAFSKDEAASAWFPFNQTFDKENLRLRIENPVAADGTPLKTGIHVANSSSVLYNTFVSTKIEDEDLDVFLIDGLLSFDKMRREYKLGKESKAYSDSYEGNVLIYNDSTTETRFEGKLNLVSKNRNFNLEASGMGTSRLDSGRYDLNTFMAFDINIPAQALTAMSNDIAGNITGYPEAIAGGSDLLFKMAEFIGDKGVRDYETKAATGYVPLPNVSPKLVRSVLLNEVNLKWSKSANAWYSVGKLNLASILKKDINAQIGGYVEIKRAADGDAVTLYLEANPYSWYYFSYYQNALTVASSDEKFNSIIAAKAKGSNPSPTTFGIIAGEPMEKAQFVNYFRNTYLGGKGGEDAPVVQQPQPQMNFDAGEEETADAKKGKKKKKGKEEAADDFGGFQMDQPAATDIVSDDLVNEKPAKKKKEKKAADEPAVDMPSDIQSDMPADGSEEPIVAEEKKPKKEKKKKPAEEAAPDIDLSN